MHSVNYMGSLQPSLQNPEEGGINLGILAMMQDIGVRTTSQRTDAQYLHQRIHTQLETVSKSGSLPGVFPTG